MTITIPKNITNGKELVIIPKEEYEALVQIREIYEFNPTTTQKKILKTARENIKTGKVLTLNELKQNLGFTN